MLSRDEYPQDRRAVADGGVKEGVDGGCKGWGSVAVGDLIPIAIRGRSPRYVHRKPGWVLVWIWMAIRTNRGGRQTRGRGALVP